jgi:hypothetical protein
MDVHENLTCRDEQVALARGVCSGAVRPQSALGMLTPREFAELGQRNAGR